MGRNWTGPLVVGLIVSTVLGCASTNDRKEQFGSVSKNTRSKQAARSARTGERRVPTRSGPMLTSPDPSGTQVPSPSISFEDTQTTANRQGLLLLTSPPTSSTSDAQTAEISGQRQPRLKGSDDTGWTKTNSFAQKPPIAFGTDAVKPASTAESRESWSTPNSQNLLLREVGSPAPSKSHTGLVSSGPGGDPPRTISRPTSNARTGLATPGPRPGAVMDHAADYSWVQGRLDYSVVGGGVWKVRYAPPSTDDEHGGSVVLDSDPSAQGYQPGDTVYVQGQIVTSQQTRTLSSPSYRVQKIARVE